jgi:ornithine carbamoyltransferase
MAHEALPAVQGPATPRSTPTCSSARASDQARFKNYEKHQPLADRTLAMIFEKASTRTRVSFEAGMYQMGGSVVHLTTGDSQLGRAEPIEDSARVISRMVDLVMIRTYEQTRSRNSPRTHGCR